MSDISRHLALLEQLMSIDKTLSLTGFRVLLTAAKHAPCSQSTIRKWSQVSKPAVSRWIGYWGTGPYEHNGVIKEGHGFLKVGTDPTDSRYSVIRLTPKGKQYLSVLEELSALEEEGEAAGLDGTDTDTEES